MEKIKEYKDIIKHKSNHEKIISNKQNDIINKQNKWTRKLNAVLLLVPQP